MREARTSYHRLKASVAPPLPHVFKSAQVEVYAVVDGQLFLIGPAELRHLRWMMHMADKEVQDVELGRFINLL